MTKALTPAPPPQPMLPFEHAIARYEAIRDRLPRAAAPVVPKLAGSLAETFGSYDGYLFDSFGVLNVGDSAIPGAADCLGVLRRTGKPFCILTNAASYTSAEAFHKYQKLGLDVRQEEILSSRDVLLGEIESLHPGLLWGAIAAPEDDFHDTRSRLIHLRGADWQAVEGFVFLSAVGWTEADQNRLVAALIARPRPVLVGNPDLVAPREGGLTVEPGFWAQDIQDRTGIPVTCFGKPFPQAFALAAARTGGGRLAMVGDTLHTDILGGQAAGHGTVLATDHGLFKGRDVTPFLAASGITPDWIVPAI